MVNKNKITLNDPVYFTPNYSGAVKISILKLYDDETALVQIHPVTKDAKNFCIPLEHIYNQAKHAKNGKHAWESYMRKKTNK